MSKPKKIRKVKPLTEPHALRPSILPGGRGEKTPIEKIRIGGHYIDRKLAHNYDIELRGLPSLFDQLKPVTQDKVRGYSIKAEPNIELNPAEEKMINVILRLLNKKSPKGSYLGNLPLPTGSDPHPRLWFTPHELYKAYTEKSDYSGQDIINIKKILIQLQDKKFLIRYQRVRVENGRQVIDLYETVASIITIATYYEGLTEEELAKVKAKDEDITNERGQIILDLHPIFIDQIDTKFIEYPGDINNRTAIAAGGDKKVTPAITRLRDHLQRHLSGNNGNKAIVGYKKLTYILGLENYIKQRKKKIIRERIESAIDVCKTLGIVERIEEKTGAGGELQIVFYLNKEWI